MTISGPDLYTDLKRFNALRGTYGPRDTLYLRPHVAWLKLIGDYWAKNERPKLNYTPDAYDCDDFADEFGLFIRKQILYTGSTGVSVAMAWTVVYLSLTGNPFGIDSGSHATNFILTADDDWHWFDAYSGKSAKVEFGADLLGVGIANVDFVLV